MARSATGRPWSASSPITRISGTPSRRRLDQGMSEEQAMEQVRLEDYAHWGQYEARFPLNAGAVYRWLA